MSGLGSNIGSSSIKRRIATVIAVVGAIVVGGQLASVWPRQVEVAYMVDPGVTGIDIDYLQEGDVVASARFKQPDPTSTVIRHDVRLQPGEYQVRIVLHAADGRGIEELRLLQVPVDGLTRFDLKEATKRSE